MSTTPSVDGTEPVAELHEHLRALARALVADPAQADDIVQEAWVAALSQPPGRVRGISAWMRGVVRNIARREDLRARRRREIEALSARSQPDEDFEARLVDGASTYRTLRGLTEALPAAERAVIALHYFEGLSIEEVARALQRPVETVRTQRRRGLQGLRAELDRRHSGERTLWTAWLAPWHHGERATRPRAPRRFALRAASAFTGAALVVAVVLAVRGTNPPGAAHAPSRDVSSATEAFALAPPRDVAPREAANVAAPVSPPPVSPGTRAPDERRLTIRVRTPEGLPAPYASVTYMTSDDVESSVQADEAGIVEIAVRASVLVGEPFISPEIGGVAVCAVLEGVASSHLYFVAMPVEGRTFDLPLGGPGEHLSLRVIDPSGAPVFDAQVVVDLDVGDVQTLDDGTMHTYVVSARATDAEGRVSFANLERRPHTVAVCAPGFALARPTLAGGAPSDVREVRLERGGEVVGSVRGPDGTPVPGASVRCVADEMLRDYEPQSITDELGSFRLSGVPAGRQWILARDAHDERLVDDAIVEAESGGSATCHLRLAERPNLVVRAGDGRGPAGSGLMVVAKAAGGAPAWGTAVELDESGRAELVGVPRCALDVALFDARSQTVVARTAVGPEERDEIAFAVPTDSSTSLSTLSGTLVDERGAPFEGGGVVYALAPTASAPEATAFVDRTTGRFERLFAPPGPRRVFAIVGEGAFDAGRVELAAGELRDLGAIRAPPTGTLVIDRGAAHSATHVDCEVQARLEFESNVLLRAVAVVPAERNELALRPGRYVLRAVLPNGAVAAPTEFEVRSGELVRVRLP